MSNGMWGPTRPCRTLGRASAAAVLLGSAALALAAEGPRTPVSCGPDWAWSYELRFLAIGANPAGRTADKAPSPCGGTRIMPMDSPWLGPKDFLRLSKMFGDQPVDVLPWGYLSTAAEGGEARLSGAVPSREPWMIHFIGIQTEGSPDLHELALSLEGLGHHFDGEITFQARSGETRGVLFGLPSRGQLIVLVTPRRCGVLVPELARQRRYFADQAELTPPVSAQQAAPAFPVMARVRNVEGAVVMRVLVDEKGQLSDPLVLASPHNESSLVKAAVDALRNWQYRPARENGVPVPVFQTITMSFTGERTAPPASGPPRKTIEARTTPQPPPP